MEQLRDSLVAAGVDREMIETTRHGGTADQCVTCHQEEIRTINIVPYGGPCDEKAFSTDEILFKCTLCSFLCLKWEQIFHHIENYTRYITAASKKKVTNHFPTRWRVGSRMC